jgi:hypothetical protein
MGESAQDDETADAINKHISHSQNTTKLEQ